MGERARLQNLGVWLTRAKNTMLNQQSAEGLMADFCDDSDHQEVSNG